MRGTGRLATPLAIARRAKGLTQEELADLVGVTQPTIARLEAGKKPPSLRLALRISSVLGFSVEELFGMAAGETARSA